MVAFVTTLLLDSSCFQMSEGVVPEVGDDDDAKVVDLLPVVTLEDVSPNTAADSIETVLLEVEAQIKTDPVDFPEIDSVSQDSVTVSESVPANVPMVDEDQNTRGSNMARNVRVNLPDMVDDVILVEKDVTDEIVTEST